MVYSKISILEATAMSLSTDGVPEKKCKEKEANQSKRKNNLASLEVRNYQHLEEKKEST